MDIAYSVNGVPIRLTEERWRHIVSNKPYMEAYYDVMLEIVEQPTWILRGYAGSLVAVRPLGRHQYLHVIYKELQRKDGFIITAFMSRKYNRALIIWTQNS
jgi:hypothetical protein